MLKTSGVLCANLTHDLQEPHKVSGFVVTYWHPLVDSEQFYTKDSATAMYVMPEYRVTNSSLVTYNISIGQWRKLMGKANSIVRHENIFWQAVARPAIV